MSAIAQIRNWLSQFTGYPVAQELTVEDYQPTVVVLKTQLNTTTTANNDTYKVPDPYNFLLQRIRGMCAIRALTSETLTITGVGNLTVPERISMKSGNCRVEFTNSDKKYDIIENQTMALSAIMAELGASPVEFDPPLPVLTAQNLKATFTLLDTTAAVVGAATDYGLVLEGVLVRTSRG